MALSRKREREPEYYYSKTRTRLLNYNVYYMKKTEWLLYSVIICSLGALIGYLFYGGIGLNQHGEPTKLTYLINSSVMLLFALAAWRIVMPMVRKNLLEKRKNKLRKQFVDLLESLAVSVSAGQNIPNAMQTVKHDLLIQYSESDYIISEVNTILKEMENGVPIEEFTWGYFLFCK